jgi:hypothetical protein
LGKLVSVLVNNSQLLQANIDILKVEIGQAVLPLFEDMLGFVNAVILAYREGHFDEDITAIKANFDGLLNGILKPLFFFTLDSIDYTLRQYSLLKDSVMLGFDFFVDSVSLGLKSTLPMVINGLMSFVMTKIDSVMGKVGAILNVIPGGEKIKEAMGFDDLQNTIKESANLYGDAFREKQAEVAEGQKKITEDAKKRMGGMKDTMTKPSYSEKLKDLATRGNEAINESRERIRGQIGSNESLVSKNLLEEEAMKAKAKATAAAEKAASASTGQNGKGSSSSPSAFKGTANVTGGTKIMLAVRTPEPFRKTRSYL